MSGYLPIEGQVAGMKMFWPGFKLKWFAGSQAIWVGEVKPLMQTFTIAIAYRAPSAVELPSLRRMQPRVRVLSPQLRPRNHDTEGELPHVYYTGPGALDVFLCLFDPETDEWNPGMSIAKTTLPWSIDWLAAYEGWRATGRWTATGKHLARQMETVD